MRKIFAFLLILCILPVASSAHRYDAFTDDELKQIYSEVQQEMYSRGMLPDNAIITGVYVVGEDIPVGSYIIKALSIEPEPYSTQLEATCVLYDKVQDHDHEVSRFTLTKGQEVRVSLEEGHIIRLFNMNLGIITKAAPLIGE